MKKGEGLTAGTDHRGPPSAWWLGAVIGGALIIRVGFFGGLLGWDDVEYVEAAQALRAGDYAPSSSFRLRYGLIVPLAATQAWLGPSEYAAALVPLTFSLTSLLLVYALGVLYGGPSVGLAAAGFLAVLPLDVIAATDLHTDLPVSVFMAGAFYAVKRGETGGRWEPFWFVGGGLTLGFAYLTKEVALALGVVLAIRLLWLRKWWRGYGWLAGALFAVVCADGFWGWWLTGSPWYRYSTVASERHVARMMMMAPSYAWTASYPSMLVNPLDGNFGYFAGIAYPVLAGTLWGIRRQDRAVQELLVWWGSLLVVFNFTPLDWSLTRPLFHHFPRTLHPILVPFVLAAAVWLLRGLAGRSGLQTGTVGALVTLAAVGVWATHFDYRLWASVARQVAHVVSREPSETLVVTDPFNAGLLRILLPERLERIVAYSDAALAAPSVPTLVLRDPLFLASALHHGHAVPSVVLSPPASWERLRGFTRQSRKSVRGLLLSWIGVDSGRVEPIPVGAIVEPAVLWRIPPASREGP